MLFMVVERFRNRDDARLLQRWVAFWSDLIEFEMVPVVPSAETRETIESML